MPRSKKPDNTIQELLIVSDPAAIKLLFTPKYTAVLKLIESEEMSVSDIARALDINPGSAHYHLKVLEQHGLVKLVREEIKGGVVKKFYHKSARHISIDASRPESATAASSVGLDENYKERLLKSMKFFGYDIPPEKFETAKADLTRCDARMKAIMQEVQQAGLEKTESDRVLVSNAYQLALLMRLIDDKECYGFLRGLIDASSEPPVETSRKSVEKR